MLLIQIKRYYPYAYFGDILILCIIKFFRDNLELLDKSTGRRMLDTAYSLSACFSIRTADVDPHVGVRIRSKADRHQSDGFGQ